MILSKAYLKDLTYHVNGAAIEVHKILGPGLLESAYHKCLKYEVVELKAIEKVLPIHEAQIITYMKLLNSPKGIVYNFNTVNLYADGQKTYVNDYFRVLPED